MRDGEEKRGRKEEVRTDAAMERKAGDSVERMGSHGQVKEK